MKLPNQTRGPVTLRNIDYAKNLSQETYAFTAEITVVVGDKTLSAPVSNQGQGGANFIQGTDVEDAVDAYAQTLPPYQGNFGAMTRGPLPIDADFLISLMVGDAIEAYELHKLLARKLLFVKPDSTTLYSITRKARPVELLIAQIEKNAPGARILNQLPFDEALSLFKTAMAS